MSLSRPAARQEWQRRAWILGCAIAAVLPLVIRGNSCGHDFDFHLQSWLAVAEQWRHGVIYPHWIQGANYGAGEPRLVFYPPFSWMLGALLATTLPWKAVPIAFTLIVLIACGLSMKRLANECLSANAATVAACAYILNPYALFVAYERTAYGELAAGIWLPLIVLYALRIPSGIHRHELNAAVPLALTIAAVWLTNAPAAVMGCYLLAGIALWLFVTQRGWQSIFTIATSLVLGLGVAAFYLVPAAYERRWVDIARAIGPGMRIEDSYLFGHTGESFHDQVLRTASCIFVTMLASLAVFGWIAWKRHTARPWLLPLFAAAAVLVALQLPWSHPIWLVAPELRFLQFPWRLSLILSTGFALALGAATTARPTGPAKPTPGLRTAVVLVIVFALVFTAARLFWQPCDEEDAVAAQMALFQSGAGFEGTDEYTPIGTDNSLLPKSLPLVRLLIDASAETPESPGEGEEAPQYTPIPGNHIAAQVQIQRWQPERIAFLVNAKSPGFAVLRLLDYPSWQVSANGKHIDARPDRDDGLMAIPIGTGATQIEISYVTTPDLAWGRSLSLASCLTLIALATTARYRHPVD